MTKTRAGPPPRPQWGYFGIRRSLHQGQKRFYWPGWARDVRRTVKLCEQCARFKRPPYRRQGLLQALLVGKPWERIVVDLTGPIPTSSKENCYIVTRVDYFTK